MRQERISLDETSVTELEIGPDGRVYVFGASPEILKVLESIGQVGDAFGSRLHAAGAAMQQETSVVRHE